MPGCYPSSLLGARMDEADTISQQVLALQDKFNVGSHQSRVEWMHRWSVRGEEPIGGLPRCRACDFGWFCCGMARAWEVGMGRNLSVMRFRCDTPNSGPSDFLHHIPSRSHILRPPHRRRHAARRPAFFACRLTQCPNRY